MYYCRESLGCTTTFWLFLEDMSPFWGGTDTPSLDDVWVSKPEAAALFELCRGICVTHSLRFTSGVTPADRLVASMAAKPSLPHTCKALVGLKTGSYHATTQSAYITSLCQFTNYIVDPVQPR